MNLDDDGERDWTEATALAAPALLGAAGGLILGEMMHSRARRGMALGFAALGVATLLPLAIGGIVNLVNGPQSKFGARRRLRKIRDGGDGFVDDNLEEVGII
ncbi:hypothetical protein [Luteolibacter marinus]|uniref:hypothetical protein n=1 Tax=Luteolibacter marinus TaxID=2776705 RepID=UPI00186716F1|nr:hypothetical protein [Luteolibacter marinus]